MMVEEKKGHAKITIEVELNEALMEVIKESIKNMPRMGSGVMRRMMRGRGEQSEESE
jgi:hypothetical protein